MSFDIEFRRRRYKLERQLSPAIPTVSHPLRGITMVDGKMKKKLGISGSSGSSKQSSRAHSPSRTQAAPLDPLSAAISASLTSTAVQLDPLSALASEAETSGTSAGGKLNGCDETSSSGNETEPWSARRSEILSRFTTSEKLSIVSSFLDPEGVNRRASTEVSVRERVQSRLEQLDDFEEGSVRETGNLTQQEYVGKITELSHLLKKFWTSGERVRALKIAIQCAKLLSSVAVVRFYPSKFVLVTDLLEDFGALVFERLMDKAVHQSAGRQRFTLPANFRPSQVPEAAKETTRNWFYKIASIRELLPRLYVEAALLQNYRYLDPQDISRALLRLCHQARGIADPLVGTYLRAFIVRMGHSALGAGGPKQMAAAASERSRLLQLAFDDTLVLLKQLERPLCSRLMANEGIDLPAYLTLFSPALDWLIHCLLTAAQNQVETDSVCEMVLRECDPAGPFQTLLIHSLLSTLPPTYIAENATRLASLIARASSEGATTTGYPRHLLYQQFGACMVLSPPGDHGVRLAVLQEVWKLVRLITVPKEYVLCADTWVEFVAKHFGRKDINALLGDIVQHVTPDRSFEELYGQLQSILTKLLAHTRTAADLHALFGSEKFLQFVDLFQRDFTRIQACTAIFELFNRIPGDHVDGVADVLTTDDPVVVNTLLYLGRLMHDSLDILNSSEGDQRMVSALLKGFISRVDFTKQLSGGEAVERQLGFYVDCRAAFPGLEPVLVHLSQAVNALAMACLKRVRHNHTAKSGAFVRACVAYSFITIPSLTDTATRVRLYAHTGQVALANGCLGQADACFKSAIGLLRELPRQTVTASSPSMTASLTGRDVPGSGHGAVPAFEAMLQELTALLASSLLMAPDNPNQGCLYLLKGLLNAVAEGAGMNVALRTQAYLHVLPLMAALRQPDYAYHAAGSQTDANDRLYGSAPAFLAELGRVSSTVLQETVAGLPGCPLTSTYHLLHHLVRLGRLSHAPTRTVIIHLWRQAEQRTGSEVSISSEANRLRRGVTARLKTACADQGDQEEAEGAAELLNEMGIKK